MKTVAQRLKEARELKGWTQAQLAVAADVSTGTIGNIESGARQSKGSIPQIAKALEVNYDWLANEEGPMLPVTGAVNAGIPFNAQATGVVATPLIDLLSTLKFLTDYMQGLDPSDRKAAMVQIASLTDEPERCAKVAASIQAMASTGFAKNGRKAA